MNMLTRLSRILTALVILTMVSGASAQADLPLPADHTLFFPIVQTCPDRAHMVALPNLGAERSYLIDVIAFGPTDAWATGRRAEGEPLLLRWDGTAWATAPLPDLDRPAMTTAIAGVAANDIWLVGYHQGQKATLAVHWNGSDWHIVPTPPTPESVTATGLNSVAALASNDVWAVGYESRNVGTHDENHSIILHWDGKAWARVPTPASDEGGDSLWAVSGVAADDVWTVGWNRNAQPHPLLWHWNGRMWEGREAGLPADVFALGDVLALATDDVWLTGWSLQPTPPILNVILHWDGHSWTRTTIPEGGEFGGYSLTRDERGRVWAAGTLLLRWEGQGWTSVPVTGIRIQAAELAAAAPIPGGGLWIVGDRRVPNQDTSQALILKVPPPCH